MFKGIQEKMRRHAREDLVQDILYHETCHVQGIGTFRWDYDQQTVLFTAARSLDAEIQHKKAVSYTHLTLPTILLV